MNGFSRFAALLALFLVVLSTAPQPARAYLDPGTGSYLFQLLIAFFVGALFTIKLYWGKLKGFSRNLRKKRGAR